MSLYTAQYVGDRIITWENYTSTKTPLSAGNLNKIQSSLSGIDTEAATAINSLDTTKADKTVVNGTVNSIVFDKNTGIFTFGFVNGTTTVVNTDLEKVVVNFAYDPITQYLVLTNSDGSVTNVDLTSLISQYEFLDSTTIGWTITEGIVTAHLIEGTITGDYLEPNYLANIITNKTAAETAQTASQQFALLSQSYAKGNSNLPSRPGEATDNAEYFKNLAEQYKDEAQQIADDNNYVIGVDPTTIQDPGSPYLRPIDIINNLTSTAINKPLSAMQGKVLDEYKVNVSDIVDNLTSTETTKPLSAKQGKELKSLIDALDPSGESTFLKKSDVIDALNSFITDQPLSANQGRLLKASVDACIPTANIVDSLLSTETTKPLSANQGKLLNELKINKADIVDNLSSSSTTKPLSAKQGSVLAGMVPDRRSVSNISVYANLSCTTANVTIPAQTSKAVYVNMADISNLTDRTILLIDSVRGIYNYGIMSGLITISYEIVNTVSEPVLTLLVFEIYNSNSTDKTIEKINFFAVTKSS